MEESVTFYWRPKCFEHKQWDSVNDDEKLIQCEEKLMPNLYINDT